MSEKKLEGSAGYDAAADSAIRSNLSSIDQQYVPQPDVPRRIHIVGTGSIGKLVAYALRALPNPPPVTLVFHRYKLLQQWESQKKVITVEDGQYIDSKSGYDVELMPEIVHRRHGVDTGGDNIAEKDKGRAETRDVYAVAQDLGVRPDEAAKIIKEQQEQKGGKAAFTGMPPASKNHDPGYLAALAASTGPIHNLILTTKAIRTIPALSALRHRLSRGSTICFMQNGMGIIDEVNREIFPDDATRPNYVQGIITHGANVPPAKLEENPFYVVHAGKGTIALGAVPRSGMTGGGAQTVHSEPTGPGTSNSGQIALSDSDSENEQSNIDSSANGSVDKNGWSPTVRYTIRTLSRSPLLCAVPFTPHELFQLQLEKLAVNSVLNPLTVILDARNGAITYNFPLTRTMRLMLAETSLVIRSLPELQGIPNVAYRFSAGRLETLVVGVANKTRDNISSMLADVRMGRRTEVEYINGYIVRRGEELGIKPVVNYAVMQMVHGKGLMIQKELSDDVPIEGMEPGGGVLNRE